MIGIPLGLLYGNASEWAIHKYVLHDMGKNKKHFFSFHWHVHHRNARQNENHDWDYKEPLLQWHAPAKEIVALGVSTLMHLPLLPVAPFFTGTVFYCSLNYYFKHKKAHLDPQWAQTHLPWHYDHHMGKNQNVNWCVTHPFFDHVMGTRVPFHDTEMTTEKKMLSAKIAGFLNRTVSRQSGFKLFAKAAR